MAGLIDELKNEHKVIAGMLDQVSKIGTTSKDGRQKLMEAKQGLLAHLRKEDNELYPVLEKAAEKDPALRQTLELFAGDMSEISKSVMSFFEKHGKGESEKDFAKDIGRLFVVLKSRIGKEEDILYKEYERVSRR